MSKYPEGRIGTTEFLRRTGLSRSTFYGKYRNDPVWIEFLDIRSLQLPAIGGETGDQNKSDGPLTFAEKQVPSFIALRLGQVARERSQRADRLGAFARRGAPPPQLRRRVRDDRH